MSNKYRPSNGTEGMCFMDKFCFQCMHENPNPDKKPKCDIMGLTMMFDVTDKEYPEEWCYDENGKPTCTKFIKWDWDNDGNPDDSPNKPIPESPNQLCFPFILDEVGVNINTLELI